MAEMTIKVGTVVAKRTKAPGNGTPPANSRVESEPNQPKTLLSLDESMARTRAKYGDALDRMVD